MDVTRIAHSDKLTEDSLGLTQMLIAENSFQLSLKTCVLLPSTKLHTGEALAGEQGGAFSS